MCPPRFGDASVASVLKLRRAGDDVRAEGHVSGPPDHHHHDVTGSLAARAAPGPGLSYDDTPSYRLMSADAVVV